MEFEVADKESEKYGEVCNFYFFFLVACGFSFSLTNLMQSYMFRGSC